jgi:hypothetical protein
MDLSVIDKDLKCPTDCGHDARASALLPCGFDGHWRDMPLTAASCPVLNLTDGWCYFL